MLATARCKETRFKWMGLAFKLMCLRASADVTHPAGEILPKIASPVVSLSLVPVVFRSPRHLTQWSRCDLPRPRPQQQASTKDVMWEISQRDNATLCGECDWGDALQQHPCGGTQMLPLSLWITAPLRVRSWCHLFPMAKTSRGKTSPLLRLQLAGSVVPSI